MNRLLSKIERYEFSIREFFFLGLILFLGGLLIGMVASPKGERTIGSNNGNNNGNNQSECLPDESNGDNIYSEN